MRTIDPKQTPTPELHQYLLGIVAPRPIAFASTVDEHGTPSLAPCSFFNCFSSNPPIVVFSSNRRVSDNSTKDTLHNVQATGEVVINAVSYDIVRQMAVASAEFPSAVNEFEKSGFTPLAADLVKPFRVAEAKASLECKVQEIIPLGEQGGAGHLVICEVVRIHLREDVLDDKGRIDPHKMDLVGRMGRAFYARASGEAIHRIHQPFKPLPIGYDQLPATAKRSTVLTANDLGQLAGLHEPPAQEAVQTLSQQNGRIREILNGENPLESLHRFAHLELAMNRVAEAAQAVWLGEELFGG